MQKFKIEFSKAHSFEFGDYFLSKLVNKSSDELLGLSSKKTYFLWGTKELEGELELNIEEYITKSKSFTTEDGKDITLEYIVAKR